MPCGDPTPSILIPHYAEAESLIFKEYQRLTHPINGFMHNSLVAQNCCEAMKLLVAAELLDECSPDLKAWWQVHQIRDAAREQKYSVSGVS